MRPAESSRAVDLYRTAARQGTENGFALFAAFLIEAHGLGIAAVERVRDLDRDVVRLANAEVGDANAPGPACRAAGGRRGHPRQVDVGRIGPVAVRERGQQVD